MNKTDKKYGIYTIVAYDTVGMSFNPTKAEFITHFDKILSDM